MLLTSREAFYRYFYTQNELIKNGTRLGIEIELNTLGIGNGIIDAATQFPLVGNSIFTSFNQCCS